MYRQRLSSLIIIFVCLVVGVSGSYAQVAKVSAPAAKPGQETPAKAIEEKSGKVSQPVKPADPAPGASVPAKPAASQTGKPGKDSVPKYDVEDFAFSPETSRNPFEPILLLKAKTSRGMNVKASTGNKTAKAKPEKIDKLDYTLEELRLVGIIKSGTGGMIAMMEDSQGKGVFFRKGDYLNKNLWVMDVTASAIMLGYKAKGELKKIAVDIPTKK